MPKFRRYEFETDWPDYEQENGRFMHVSDYVRIVAEKDALLQEALTAIGNAKGWNWLDSDADEIFDLKTIEACENTIRKYLSE